MLDTSLPRVVCRRANVLFMLIMLLCTFRVSFLFCFSTSCVPYVGSFPGLSILNAPSVLSNVYLDSEMTFL